MAEAPLPKWFKPLLLSSFGAFACLAWAGSAFLSPAEGLRSFDAHFFGYDHAYARSYLTALHESTGAIDAYLGWIRALDTVFIALLSATLLSLFCLRLQGGVRLAMCVLVLIYLTADYTENALIAGLLQAPVAEITPEKVRAAHLATVLKFAALVPSLGGAVWIWLRVRIQTPESAA